MIVFEQFLGPSLFYVAFIRYTVWLFVFEITLARLIPWIISAIGKNCVSVSRKKVELLLINTFLILFLLRFTTELYVTVGVMPIYVIIDFATNCWKAFHVSKFTYFTKIFWRCPQPKNFC